MKAKEWLQKVAADENGRVVISAISKRSSLANSTLTERAKADSLTADQVIAICRAYRYPVSQGLIDLEFITEEDLKLPSIQATLRDATDEQLVDEIARRLEQGRREVFDRPIRPVDDRPVLSEVPDTMPPLEEMAANPHRLELEQGDHLED
ncbi:hypothetical protein INS90_10255 [Trueperella pecoris]|uniref:Uncharacterized protein n=1 Tax=Trueperella pecoris TaxID=2733571 RepID=A0A7M1R0K6_9ACTO|nr:hypothetical protein [Trueperella pecoris]QOR47611.1 hypothetical protein INS90_10255 [Trueperella pecoris]